MSKYKRIKAVAHNFAHSFTSMMNFGDNEYIMDKLISSMYAHQADSVTLDVLNAKLTPQIQLEKQVSNAITYYCTIFYAHQLQVHDLTDAYIHHISMQLTVLWPEKAVWHDKDNSISIPYCCTMKVIDDKDRSYHVEIRSEEVVSKNHFNDI